MLRIAVNKDSDNPFAWLQLGTVYELKGDTARASLATAERASMTGDTRTAVYSARAAMAGAAAQHARLDPRAGHRADRPERTRRQEAQEEMMAFLSSRAALPLVAVAAALLGAGATLLVSRHSDGVAGPRVSARASRSDPRGDAAPAGPQQRQGDRRQPRRHPDAGRQRLGGQPQWRRHRGRISRLQLRLLPREPARSSTS